jgi:uncharacterized tellurite resistance protein B-like protein
MFINMLLDDEKRGFVWLLQYLSQIDGQVTEDEISFLNRVCLEVGVNLDEITCDFHATSLDAILAEIKTPFSKNIVIMELINLAYADKEYSTKEREGIKYIANQMGVHESKIFEKEEWVKDGISWANRGYLMISSTEGAE